MSVANTVFSLSSIDISFSPIGNLSPNVATIINTRTKNKKWLRKWIIWIWVINEDVYIAVSQWYIHILLTFKQEMPLHVAETEEHTSPAHRHPHDAPQDFLQLHDIIFKISGGTGCNFVFTSCSPSIVWLHLQRNGSRAFPNRSECFYSLKTHTPHTSYIKAACMLPETRRLWNRIQNYWGWNWLGISARVGTALTLTACSGLRMPATGESQITFFEEN